MNVGTESTHISASAVRRRSIVLDAERCSTLRTESVSNAVAFFLENGITKANLQTVTGVRQAKQELIMVLIWMETYMDPLELSALIQMERPSRQDASYQPWRDRITHSAELTHNSVHVDCKRIRAVQKEATATAGSKEKPKKKAAKERNIKMTVQNAASIMREVGNLCTRT
jgi:hypothetical protein